MVEAQERPDSFKGDLERTMSSSATSRPFNRGQPFKSDDTAYSSDIGSAMDGWPFPAPRGNGPQSNDEENLETITEGVGSHRASSRRSSSTGGISGSTSTDSITSSSGPANERMTAARRQKTPSLQDPVTKTAGRQQSGPVTNVHVTNVVHQPEAAGKQTGTVAAPRFGWIKKSLTYLAGAVTTTLFYWLARKIRKRWQSGRESA